MKKYTALFALTICSVSFAYRDLETGTFLTRDPLGYKDGPNMYCYVHGNPITKFDAMGLYADDMHYLGAYAAMLAAGVANERASEIAYYSAYPDKDSQYDAMSNLMPGENQQRAASIHMLEGSSAEQNQETRATLSEQIPRDAASGNNKSAGVKLHMYGDTFGHLQMDYDSGKRPPAARHKGIGGNTPSKPNGKSKDSTYKFDTSKLQTGHLKDGTKPDQVRYRPDAAEDYIKGVFDMFGGTDKEKLKTITDSIDNIRSGNMNPKAAYSEMQKLVEQMKADAGVDPTTPKIEDVERDDPKAIEPTDMDEILTEVYGSDDD